MWMRVDNGHHMMGDLTRSDLRFLEGIESEMVEGVMMHGLILMLKCYTVIIGLL